MHLHAVRIDVPQVQSLAANGEVAEAVDVLAEGGLAAVLEGADAGAAAAGDDERGLQSVELQVLQVVVVAAEVHVHAVVLKEAAPGGDQAPRVAVRPVAVERMMAD